VKIPLTYKRPGRISLRYVKDAAGHGHKPAEARPRTDYAAAHAPKGGVTIGGKQFKGGQFIPAEVMAKATPEERAAVESGESRGKPLPPEGGVKLKEPQSAAPPPTLTTSPATGPAAVDHTSPEAFATSLANAYGAAGHDPALARAVSARFPAHVRTRLARGLKTVRVHPSVEGVVESFYADDPTGRLASVPPDKRQRTLGFYDASQRHLETDGGPDPAGTLAHELGHAADYEGDWDLSSSDEFRYAWFREIKGGRLTAYAATEPAEGFAELFRFLYGQDGDTSGVAAQLFPLCHAFFKKHGLV